MSAKLLDTFVVPYGRVTVKLETGRTVVFAQGQRIPRGAEIVSYDPETLADDFKLLLPVEVARASKKPATAKQDEPKDGD